MEKKILLRRYEGVLVRSLISLIKSLRKVITNCLWNLFFVVAIFRKNEVFWFINDEIVKSQFGLLKLTGAARFDAKCSLRVG